MAPTTFCASLYLNQFLASLKHDQQFPDEPKQIRPGEDVQVTDGKVQVSGQIAVMAIDERLVQMLMEKNPDAAFAMEQSFPLKSTYAQATTLGPIMELRVQDPQNALTAERAAQSLDYWQTAAQQVLQRQRQWGHYNPQHLHRGPIHEFLCPHQPPRNDGYGFVPALVSRDTGWSWSASNSNQHDQLGQWSSVGSVPRPGLHQCSDASHQLVADGRRQCLPPVWPGTPRGLSTAHSVSSSLQSLRSPALARWGRTS